MVTKGRVTTKRTAEPKVVKPSEDALDKAIKGAEDAVTTLIRADCEGIVESANDPPRLIAQAASLFARSLRAHFIVCQRGLGSEQACAMAEEVLCKVIDYVYQDTDKISNMVTSMVNDVLSESGYPPLGDTK